jgi:hypothetical protein
MGDGGYIGRWVAKFGDEWLEGGRLSSGDGWLRQLSGSNPDISKKKYKMGDISKRSGHHTLTRQKNI